MALFNRHMSKLWVHFCVFVRFTFDGNCQCLDRCELTAGMAQIQVAEGMLHLLIGSRLKRLCCCEVPSFAGNFGKLAVFNMRHRLPGKSRF